MSAQAIFEIDFFLNQPTKTTDKDAQALALSSKLVLLFQERVDDLKLSGLKVTLSQLKNVYKAGAEDYCADTAVAKNRGHFALARVNMFVRMLSERGDFYKKANKSKAKTSQLFLDVASYFEPIEEDYARASADIERCELAYDFQSVNELYLEAPENNRFWFEL